MSKFNFYEESKKYMQGYSKWHFYTRLPKAYIKFKWLSRHD
jgi:hypothetical protein